MVKKGGIVKQYPREREMEKPAYPGQKPQYRPGFGPQGKTPKPASNLFVIIVVIILIIVFAIVLISYFRSASNISQYDKDDGGDTGGESGGNDCTCYCDVSATVCTSNSQCPSVDGVPGYCGCPVGC